MTSQKNTEYNLEDFSSLMGGFLTNATIAASVAISPVAATPFSDVSLQDTSGTSYFYDNFNSNSTSSVETPLDNSMEMAELLELSQINIKIKEIYNTSIKNHWIPNKDFSKKSCLLVELHGQEELEKSYDDLELDLYVQLKPLIDNSNFFEMIALI